MSKAQTHADGAYEFLHGIDWRNDPTDVVQAVALVAIAHALLAIREDLRDRA